MSSTADHPTRIILVRHGETDWNRAGRIQGSTDIPLNDTGRSQARDAAERLVAEVTDAATVAVVSSDLSRARETATLIADRLALPLGPSDIGLRERGYGIAEGFDVTEFRARFGDTHSGEVPGAETVDEVADRANDALRRLIAASGSPDVLIAVAHGALIRAVLRAAASDAAPTDDARVGNGEWRELALTADGRLVAASTQH
ncbi:MULTISPECIES: histidine phosphatase family protein [Microbacterium]|uniref:histidine phosphatase family protein n=1 Tax=Microbacterium TaxID=33882 RepID=UPI0010F44892|nr:histidine phosphatase family protein [Microbacterium sp. 4NA327F11]MCK9914240.1 histidine phosphatase family protein [Microbacteriaceae bacterium K1510]